MKLLFVHAAAPAATSRRSVVIEQLTNSAIVAGVAGLATWTGVIPDPLVMGKAFLVTFLIELRKYRGLGQPEQTTPPPATTPPLSTPAPGA